MPNLPAETIDMMKAQKDDPAINYRWAADPEKSCGVCVHFSAPGACELVMGVIRPVDTCNLWAPRPEGRAVHAEFLPEEQPESPAVPRGTIQAEDARQPVQAELVGSGTFKSVPVQSEWAYGTGTRPVQAEFVRPGHLRQVQAELAEAGRSEMNTRFDKGKWITINGAHVLVGSKQHGDIIKGAAKKRQGVKDTVRNEGEMRAPGGRFMNRGKTHKAKQAVVEA